MRNFIFIFLILFSILLSSLSIASDTGLVEQFIKLSDVTKVKGATQKDIDAVAELLSENMRYQHPNYNADLSKEQFIAGLVRFMGTAESLTTKITNSITGEKAVVVEYISKTVINGKTELDPKPLMRLLEFSDGKIVLVREYW